MYVCMYVCMESPSVHGTGCGVWGLFLCFEIIVPLKKLEYGAHGGFCYGFGAFHILSTQGAENMHIDVYRVRHRQR